MKVNVKSPHAGKNYFRLPTNHPTSFEFGQVRPVYSRPLFYGDKIKCNLNMLVRTAPLTYPTFGNVKFVHRAFFVPFRLVNPYYHEFRNNIPILGIDGEQTHPHLFTYNVQDLMFNFCSEVYNNNRYVLGSFAPTGYPAFQWRGTGTKFSGTVPAFDHMYYSQQIQNEFCTARVVYTDNGSTFTNNFLLQLYKDTSLKPDFIYALSAKYVSGDTQEHVYYVCCRLSPYGRYILKIFNSLGIKISFEFENPTLGSVTELSLLGPKSYKPATYNALSLLAFAKILSDYYVPSQYQISAPYQRLFKILQNRANKPISFASENYDLGFNEVTPPYNPIYTPLSYLLESFKIGYQVFSGSNYFTDAWQSENEVVTDLVNHRNETLYSRLEFMAGGLTYQGYETNQNTVDNSNTGQYFHGQTLDEVRDNANSIGHTWLRKVQNFVTRNNLVGNRVVDNLLARFGVRPSDAKLQLSTYIGRDENTLQIQDVTATASTGSTANTSILGEYAGKAFSVNVSKKEFEFKCNEEGLFVILSTLTNYDNLGQQGTQRFHFLSDYKDFPIPEFEKVGLEPISAGELVSPTLLQDNTSVPTHESYTFDTIFGFVPRYASFKYPFNLQSGDFTIPSVGGGIFGELSAYHLQRMLRFANLDSYSVENYQAKSSPYQKVRPMAQKEILFDNGIQYNRIFNVVDNLQDHFFAIMQFDVRLTSSTLLPVKDSFDIDGFQDVEIEKNGSVIS